MAEHFEEVTNLRLSAIEHRLDSEVAPMQQAMNVGFATMVLGFGRVIDRIEGLEHRMDRLEAKFDDYLERTLAALADIQRRLPPSA